MTRRLELRRPIFFTKDILIEIKFVTQRKLNVNKYFKNIKNQIDQKYFITFKMNHVHHGKIQIKFGDIL